MFKASVPTLALTQPGTAVGVRYGRWPYASAHPGCWGTPLLGTVLSVDAPEAWAGRLAFPGTGGAAGLPPQADVDAHLARLRAGGLLATDEAGRPGRVPVRWALPDGTGPVVHWEETANLRPYADDLAAWEAARAAAYAAADAAARQATTRGTQAHLTLVRAA